jgi:hypothetical protein
MAPDRRLSIAALKKEKKFLSFQKPISVLLNTILLSVALLKRPPNVIMGDKQAK